MGPSRRRYTSASARSSPPRAAARASIRSTRSVITLGAMDDNDLVVNDETVSRYHCKIVQEAHGLAPRRISSRPTARSSTACASGGHSAPAAPSARQRRGEVQRSPAKLPIVAVPEGAPRPVVGRHVKMRELFGILEKIAPTGPPSSSRARRAPARRSSRGRSTSRAPRAKGPILRRRLRRRRRTPDRERAVRPRDGAPSPGAVTPRRALFELADGRHALPRRDRRAPARPPAASSCACSRRARSRRVGAPRPIQVDVRIIAATNRNLERGGDGPALPRGPLLPPLRRPRSSRRCASGARTSRSSSTAPPPAPRVQPAPRRRPARQRLPRRHGAPRRAPAGRATSASW